MTREEANITIDYLKEMQEGYIEGEGYERHPLPEWYALDKAIKVLEQESILDKIRAEIENMEIAYDKSPNYEDDRTDEEKAVDWFNMNKFLFLQIIDKYKE